MFKTQAGPVEGTGADAYLRPETAQGMFTNFGQVLQTTRKKPPFGIAQVGKSFRNEITPQNWIFRTREFEQMETRVLRAAGRERRSGTSTGATTGWTGTSTSASLPTCCSCGRTTPTSCRTIRPGPPTSSSSSRGASTSSRASPSAPTSTSSQHAEHSGERLDYFDPQTNERYVPYVIEPAAGATRTMAAFLLAAYDEDVVNDETRTVLRLHPRLAPYKVAVLPLSKKDTLTPLAQEIRATLAERYMVDYDETQNIGKRYRRQDEIGTPLCVTVDFDSLDDDAVTIRDRDTTEQVRVPIADAGRHGRRPPRVLTARLRDHVRAPMPARDRAHEHHRRHRQDHRPARQARRRRRRHGVDARPRRERAGHARVHLHEDQAEADVMWVYEEYTDQAALDSHGSSDAMKALGGSIGPFLAGRPELVFTTRRSAARASDPWSAGRRDGGHLPRSHPRSTIGPRGRRRSSRPRRSDRRTPARSPPTARVPGGAARRPRLGGDRRDQAAVAVEG